MMSSSGEKVQHVIFTLNIDGTIVGGGTEVRANFEDTYNSWLSWRERLPVEAIGRHSDN